MTSTEGMLELARRGRSDFACLFGKRNCKHQQCWQQFVADFALMVMEAQRDKDARLLESFAEQLLTGLPDIAGSHNAKEYARAIRQHDQDNSEVLAAVRARMEKG